MQRDIPTATVRRIAAAHELPPEIVQAVIDTESAGNTFATRFERHYRWCWNVQASKPFTASPGQANESNAPNGFPGTSHAHGGFYSSADTEWIGQKTSWGAMQTMGAVAREHGFDGPFPALCDPEIGIEYGCRHLARLRDRFFARHGWAGVLDAFNDGTARIERTPDYPHHVADKSPAARALIFPKA